MVITDTATYGTNACVGGGGNFGGCTYESMTELEVYGAPSP